MATRTPGGIYVLAGTNGAGKSSVLGGEIALEGSDFFNPDESAQRLLDDDPNLTLVEANSQAWQEMVRLLVQAIDEGLDYFFETTLGRNTIPGHLLRAISLNRDVRIAYVGLETVELHIERVRRRVEDGGHDIPEEAIRYRYNSSRENLLRLMPGLRELWLFDNSVESETPDPSLIMHMEDGHVVSCCPTDEVPGWAKPLVVAGHG